MGKVTDWFDLTPAQSKFVISMGIIALVLSAVLFIRTYSTEASQSPALPVFVSDPETKFTGIFVLDPNTAPADSLELLPGVGKVLADRIVEYRATHRFKSEVDITEVKGIGAKLFEQIRPYLKITTP